VCGLPVLPLLSALFPWVVCDALEVLLHVLLVLATQTGQDRSKETGQKQAR
jgi:hypothetical protein